jgi:hypothetical protein
MVKKLCYADDVISTLFILVLLLFNVVKSNYYDDGELSQRNTIPIPLIICAYCAATIANIHSFRPIFHFLSYPYGVQKVKKPLYIDCLHSHLL